MIAPTYGRQGQARAKVADALNVAGWARRGGLRAIARHRLEQARKLREAAARSWGYAELPR